MARLSSFNGLIAVSAIIAIGLQLNHSNLFYLFKPLTTVLVITLLWVHGRSSDPQFFKWMLAGLIACLAGDTLLMKEAWFVFGLGAFLLGHLCFLRAFTLAGHGGFKLYWWVLLPLAAFGIAYYAFLLPQLKELAVPVAVYFLVILMMAWQGVALWRWQPRSTTLMIAVAVLLFLFSDSIIALNKFMLPFELANVVILASYWLSVSLLANAVVASASQPSSG